MNTPPVSNSVGARALVAFRKLAVRYDRHAATVCVSGADIPLAACGSHLVG